MAASAWEPQDVLLDSEQDCELEVGNVPAGHQSAWRWAAKASVAVICLSAAAVLAYISLPRSHGILMTDTLQQGELISKVNVPMHFQSQGANTRCVPSMTLDIALQQKSGQYTYHKTPQECMNECLKFGFGASIGKCFGYTTFADESTCIVWVTPLQSPPATAIGQECFQVKDGTDDYPIESPSSYSFTVTSFTFINNCDIDVEIPDFNVKVPKKEQRSLQERLKCFQNECERLYWKWEMSNSYLDFIELNQEWMNRPGELVYNSPSYSVYNSGFSFASKFEFSGGTCQDEVARFMGDISEVEPWCAPRTESHKTRCESWPGKPFPGETVDMTCSSECAGLDFGGCGDPARCQPDNAWQCGPNPGSADAQLLSNWMLCNYYYKVSFAGSGTSHTFPTGKFVNYWCGSKKCSENSPDFMSPGVMVGETCSKGGEADLTITTCPENI